MGALFALEGHQVTFVVRGEHGRVLRERGLRFETENEVHFPSIRYVSAGEVIAPPDLIFACVKCHQIREAAPQLKNLLGPNTLIVAVQNGIENLDILAETVDEKILFGGVVWEINSVVVAPGVIRKVGRPARIVVGPRIASSYPQAVEVSQVLLRVGLRAESRADILTAQWEKLCRIATISGLACLARVPMGGLLNAKVRPLLIAALEEAIQVGLACGVPLDGKSIIQSALDVCGYAPQARPSMLLDLEQGRPLEVDWLSGAIVRAGARVQVATPIHHMISTLLDSGVDV